MADVAVTLFPAALDALLNGTTGPVARDLSRRAIRVESAAKRNASGRPGPNVRTGLLRASITWRLGRDGQGLYAEVSAPAPYSIYVELGTRFMGPFPFLIPALQAAR